jgi:hypothetical protein
MPPGKESLAGADAAHVEALQAQGIVAFTDDQLRAAAADVNDEAPPDLRRQAVGRAQVDQARFLNAGNDLDGMTERAARPRQEDVAPPGAPERIGADGPDLPGLECREALAEPGQARQRDLCSLGGDSPARSSKPGAEPDHFADAVENRDLAVAAASHHHVKTVGAEIDGRDDIRLAVRRHPGGVSVSPLGPAQTSNDDPQPQVVEAFGLRITNCAPLRSSR